MFNRILFVSLVSMACLAGCASPSSSSNMAGSSAATPAVQVEMALAAVNDWAAVWQARDVKKYLAAYAADFKPEKGSRAAWEKQRKSRVGNAKKIKLALSDIVVKSTGENAATASFMQDYKSNTYSEKSKKVLELKNVGGKWLITRERTP